jgi:hypothetical protein
MRGWVIGVAAPASVVLGALVAPLAWATVSVPRPSARAVDAAVVIGGAQPSSRSTAEISAGTGAVNRPQSQQTLPATAPREYGAADPSASGGPGEGDDEFPAAGATPSGPSAGSGPSAAPPSSTARTAATTAPVGPAVVTGNPVREVDDDTSADDDNASETAGSGSTSRRHSTTSAPRSTETSDDD